MVLVELLCRSHENENEVEDADESENDDVDGGERDCENQHETSLASVRPLGHLIA